MITGESIICFAPEPWDTIWRNRHHIMSRLARRNRVLYVEPIPYLKPILRRLLTGRIPANEVFGPSCYRVQDELFVYRPRPFLPISGKPPLKNITGELRRRLLVQTVNKLQMREPILWIYRPELHHLVGQFGERLCVYHVVDEYTGYQGVTPSFRDFLRREEMRMLGKAGMVIVVSEALYRSRFSLNANTFIVPNGVDYAAFRRFESTGDPPDEVRAISPPILGYIGLISGRLDFGCLQLILDSIPGCNLVLLGSIDSTGAESEINALLSHPRVHHLGRRSVAEMPAYLGCIDVCLIPYRVGEETINADPLKVYEYLASGKPIVACDIPSLRRFSDVVRLASTRSEFLLEVKNALSDESPDMVVRRKRVAEDSSWDRRVEHISHLIETRLLSLSESTRL